MNLGLHQYWRALANGERTYLCDKMLLALLVPLSLAYAMVLCLRAILYRVGIMKMWRLPRPVISIGNLTVGGTGKTPITAHIARLLISHGYRVAVLSRGYGGSLEGTCLVVSDGTTIMVKPEQCGDEPFLLASTIPGLMVVTGSDRYAAGLVAMEQLKPDVFLLDDCFQHISLKRDLNILLLDYNRPFGNGWTLPAGLLREPRGAAHRADLVIHTHSPHNKTTTSAFVPGKPVFAASHRLINALPLRRGDPVKFSALHGHRFLAFAGIAQPEGFFSGLREQGIDLVHTFSFPDHAVYDQERIDEIMAALLSSRAEFAITTQKDGVKLKQLPESMAAITYVARLDIELDNPVELQVILQNLFQKF